MRILRLNFIPLFLLLMAELHLCAQDWPQWRGPQRDGHVQEFSAPAKWPDSLKLVWKVATGAGLSSPVVAEGKIYLMTRAGDDKIVS